MTKLRFLAAAVCVAFLAGVGTAQMAPATPTTKLATSKPARVLGPKAEAVLSHVPADALAVLVVKDIQGVTDQVDAFLNSTNLMVMLSSQMPSGSLDALIAGARLGEGFNPNGGFAVALLNPADYGIDLAKLVPAPGVKPPAETPKLPFVLMVPGGSLEQVFGNYKITAPAAGGKYSMVALRMGDMFAVKHQGYILLSPLEKALDAVVAADKTLDKQLNKAQMAMLDESAVAAYGNMKLGAPILQDLLKRVPTTGPMMGMQPSIAQLSAILPQVEAVAAGLKFVDTGVVFDAVMTVQKDSEMAKQLAAKSKPEADLLSRLPNLPYIMAIGASSPSDDASKLAQINAQVDAASMPAALKERIKKLVADLADQMTGAQVVFGGAPEGNGVMSFAVVLQGKDAAKIQAAMPEAADCYLEFIKSVMGDNADLAKLKVTSKKDAVKVGDVSADAIVIEHPDFENNKETFTTIFGQDAMQILTAKADDKTMVLTFGGGAAMLETALKTAKSASGDIQASAADALKYLPKQRNSLVLFNAANLFQVINKGNQAMGQGGMPFMIKTATPIALCGSVEGDVNSRITVYIPQELVKEIGGIIMMMRGATGPHGGPAPAPMAPPAGNF